jgi:acyl-CoA reductase-like NAD-dependent aldehyde dehydrogenase
VLRATGAFQVAPNHEGKAAVSTAATDRDGTESLTITDPRTGAVLYTLEQATDTEIDRAVTDARRAAATIRGMTVDARLEECAKLKRHILTHKEAIIDRIVSETGKARTDALLTEIFTVLDTIDYYEKNAKKFLADQTVKTPVILIGKKSRIFYEPLGVILMIAPWNYPFNLTLTPFLAAFIAGNAVVFKPSEYTPLKGLLEDIIAKSGFTPDALQIVYGAKDVGRKLIDRRPDKIFFTGSTRAGKQIMAQAAQYLIPVELELGGKDPMIVFDDVNLERTVNGALWGAMTNSGQTCTSVERIYVQDRLFDDFVQSLRAKMEKLTSAALSPTEDDRELDMGAMTTDFQIDIVQKQLDDAAARGATILVGGRRSTRGRAFPPTLVLDAPGDAAIAREETFGPVVVVHKFHDEAEAIRLGNDSPYGLSASVWSADLDRAVRVARALETGNVSINNVLATQGNAALPYGGVKESGFGRYKGAQGLYTFCNLKSIMIDKQSARLELNWYPYSQEKYRLMSKLIDAVYSGGPAALVKVAAIAMKLEKLSKRKRL